MLNLIYHPLGNRLLVYGTKRSAQMQVGELTLIGPKIDIDVRDAIGRTVEFMRRHLQSRPAGRAPRAQDAAPAPGIEPARASDAR